MYGADVHFVLNCLAPRIQFPCEISNVTTSSAWLSWSAAAGAAYYEVNVLVNDDVISTVYSNVTSLPVSQLQSGTTYTLSVTVYDSDHQQGNIVKALFTTGSVLCI